MVDQSLRDLIQASWLEYSTSLKPAPVELPINRDATVKTRDINMLREVRSKMHPQQVENTLVSHLFRPGTVVEIQIPTNVPYTVMAALVRMNAEGSLSIEPRDYPMIYAAATLPSFPREGKKHIFRATVGELWYKPEFEEFVQPYVESIFILESKKKRKK